MSAAEPNWPSIGLDCVCVLCNKEYQYSRSSRTTKEICSTCLVNRHRWALKEHMKNYKGGSCQLCGYGDCLRSLDFHHMDPDQKEFHFGGKHNYGWDRLRAELDKCVLLCRNCHGEVENAVDMVVWGITLPILTEVQAAHMLWEPPQNFPDFTRTGWEEFHPKFIAEQMLATLNEPEPPQ